MCPEHLKLSLKTFIYSSVMQFGTQLVRNMNILIGQYELCDIIKTKADQLNFYWTTFLFYYLIKTLNQWFVQMYLNEAR